MAWRTRYVASITTAWVVVPRWSTTTSGVKEVGGGYLANACLASALAPLRRDVAAVDDLCLALDGGVDLGRLREHLAAVDAARLTVPSSLAAAASDALKFSSLLPPALATEVLQRRLSAEGSVRVVLDEPVSAYSV
jgi:hypothetical protein